MSKQANLFEYAQRRKSKHHKDFREQVKAVLRAFEPLEGDKSNECNEIPRTGQISTGIDFQNRGAVSTKAWTYPVHEKIGRMRHMKKWVK